MKKSTFMLVSLGEDKAKQVAQVISNDTSRKILDSLTQDKKSATQLSKELNIPLPTVHYNLKALTDAKLVQTKEFHYSEKGREVQHYELTNQFVIIAPAGTEEGWKQKLMALIPTVILVGGIGIALQLWNSMKVESFKTMAAGTSQGSPGSFPLPHPMPFAESVPTAPDMVRAVIDTANEEAAYAMPAASKMAAEAAEPVASSLYQTSPSVIVNYVVNTHPVLSFFAGAVAAILIYLLVGYFRKKWKR